MTAGSHFDNTLRYRGGDHPDQTALTPAYILDPVRADLGGVIVLDPCTEPDNPVGAVRFYTAAADGLSQPWDAGAIFANPPYGRAREPWVDRCVDAGARGLRVVLLMPAHTDTRCWQRAATTAGEAVFIRGRVKFGVLRPNRRQVAATHPSALLGWNVRFQACESLGLRVRLGSGAHSSAPRVGEVL